MLDEFIDFTTSLFPSISPYEQEKTKDAIKQFNLSGRKLQLFNYEPYNFLAQGDIFDGIPFICMEDGHLLAQRGKGMLISNTCSADRDEDIVMAPLIKMDILELDKSIAMKNEFYRLFYLPDIRYEDYIVDFSLLNTFNRKTLNDKIKTGEIIKETSLNQFGFYLLLCKLTICFLRPEDKEVQDNRRENYMKQQSLN